jgi:hypothetical protein
MLAQFFLLYFQLFQKATIFNNPDGGIGKWMISTDPHPAQHTLVF